MWNGDMNANSPHPEPRDEDDLLDQLLQEAAWPSPRPEAEARLTQHWQQVWSAQRRRQMFVRRAAALAVAASFLLAAALGWGWLHRTLHKADGLVAPAETANRSAPAGRRGGGAADPIAEQSRLTHTAQRLISSSSVAQAARPSRSPDAGQALAIWRPPTRLEEIMIGAFDRSRDERTAASRSAGAGRGSDAKQASPRPSSPPKIAASKGAPHAPSKADARKAIAEKKRAAAQAIVRAAVKRLAIDPKADPATVAETLRLAPLENEARLVPILTSGTPPEQLAAVRLLGQMGSSAAVPSLLQAGVDPRLHAAAIGALSRLADTPTIDEIVWQETNSELRRTLLAGLLARGDLAALGNYLSYVQSDTFGETALAAVEMVQQPPMDVLFGFLQSPSELNRLAAARVIGRIDGPATTQRLIAMIEQGTSRQEACVALLNSRGEEAVNFVKNARANPMLASLLQTASVFVSHNSQPRS
jgi:hypothetical protein